MKRRSSRTAERAISAGLVVTAAVGGYAVGRYVDVSDTAPAKSKVVATAPATKHVEAKSSSPKPATTPKPASVPALKKVNMAPPLTPTGGEFNTAAQAVADVYGMGDVQSGEAALKTIKDPEIKAQASHAMQEAFAKLAMEDVYGSGDVDAAIGLLGRITLPDIKPRADYAVSTAIAMQAAADAYGGNDVARAKVLESKISYPELEARVEAEIRAVQSNNADVASQTYDELSSDAAKQYDSVQAPIADEYARLDRHTDSYLQHYNALK